MLNVKQILMMLPIVLLAACSNKNPEKGELNFEMNGKLANAHGETLYFEHMSNTAVVVIDTIVLDSKGEFHLQTDKVKEKGFYRIKISNNNLATFIFSPNEKVAFTADVTNMANTYSIKGSKESELLMEVNRVSILNFGKRDSLQRAFQTYANAGNRTQAQLDSLKTTAEREFSALVQGYNQYVISFVEKNNTSFASLAAIQQLPVEDFFQVYVKLDESLFAKYPNSPYVQSFHTMIMAKSAITIGGNAPEINMNTPEGVPLALSSLKGKVVLIDFWASWCGPCRMENPNVVAAYNKYHEKGFDIFSVSLDRDVARWQQAIEKDNLSWKSHVSDLKAWQSPVVQQYGFSGIPYNVLIDKEGKIIAKNLRGSELERVLGEVFE